MEWLIIWLLFVIAATIVGSRKGEGFAGFVLGALLGPIGLLLAIGSSGNRIPCPFCKEMIHREASICPRCRSPLSSRDESAGGDGPSGERRT